jgi:hypothetical protein
LQIIYEENKFIINNYFMARKRVKTISESETGENLRFHDNYT